LPKHLELLLSTANDRTAALVAGWASQEGWVEERGGEFSGGINGDLADHTRRAARVVIGAAWRP
jgi:hypothetical protein